MYSLWATAASGSTNLTITCSTQGVLQDSITETVTERGPTLITLPEGCNAINTERLTLQHSDGDPRVIVDDICVLRQSTPTQPFPGDQLDFESGIGPVPISTNFERTSMDRFNPYLGYNFTGFQVVNTSGGSYGGNANEQARTAMAGQAALAHLLNAWLW